MLDKFNFYDVLGYVIPGAIVTLALYWVGVTVGIGLPHLSGDLGSSLAFIGVSYVVGHLVQSVGHRWEYGLREGLPSEDLMRLTPAHVETEFRLSHDLRDRIAAAAGHAFGLPNRPADDTTAEALLWRRELFEQCYALVVQEDAVQHTEVFLAINGLSRGLVVAAWFGFAAGAVVALSQTFFWLVTTFSPGGPTVDAWKAEGHTFALGLVAMAASVVAWRGAYNNFMLYRMNFPRSVYFSFVAWIGKQQYSAK